MKFILTNNSKIKQINGRNKTHPPPNINLTVNFEPPNKRKKRDTNLALRTTRFIAILTKQQSENSRPKILNQLETTKLIKRIYP